LSWLVEEGLLVEGDVLCEASGVFVVPLCG